MEERIFTILLIMARGLITGNDLTEDRSDITLTLTARGFMDEEVNEAYEWFEEINTPLDIDVDEKMNDIKSNRILSPEESFRVRPAAFGYLIKLKNMGIIDAVLLEEILTKVQNCGFDEIGLDEVRLLTILTLYKRDRISDWRRIIKHILDGGWESLKH